MTPDEARQQAVGYLLANADEALDSAAAELAANRLRFAINRIYYACFYATSAVLLAEQRSYAKHSGVRSALHQHLIKSGRVSAELGQFYGDMFRSPGGGITDFWCSSTRSQSAGVWRPPAGSSNT